MRTEVWRTEARYPNPELRGYKAPLIGGNLEGINAAHERAKRI